MSIRVIIKKDSLIFSYLYPRGLCKIIECFLKCKVYAWLVFRESEFHLYACLQHSPLLFADGTIGVCPLM